MARIKAKDMVVEKKLGKKDLKKVRGGLIPVPEGFDPGPVGLVGFDPGPVGKKIGSRGIILHHPSKSGRAGK